MLKRKRKHNDIISRLYAMLLHVQFVGFPIVVIIVVRCAISAPPASFRLTTYSRTAGILLCQCLIRSVPRRLAFNREIHFAERFKWSFGKAKKSIDSPHYQIY